jgi:CheY-like chemotaxis protein
MNKSDIRHSHVETVHETETSTEDQNRQSAHVVCILPLCIQEHDRKGNQSGTTSRPMSKLQIDSDMAQRHPLRILLAEDNLLNQKVALSLLRRMGYQVDVALNGRQVLAALEQHPYDVVLMDIQMPEMDGLEATHRIRTDWPEEEQPWIIALTAQAVEGDRERFLSMGMDDYVSKPVRIDVLAKALQNVKTYHHRDPDEIA